jgi:hypothetical protein
VTTSLPGCSRRARSPHGRRCRRRGGVLVEVEVTPLRVWPGSVVAVGALIRLLAEANGVDSDADEPEEAG